MLKIAILLIRVCCLLLAASLAASNSADAVDFQGTWQGYIHHVQVDRPYVFRITRDNHDRWSVRVIIDDDWGTHWTAASISVGGRRIKIAVPSLGSTYDGQLSEDGRSLTGLWSLGQRLVPLGMIRATPSTLWRETPHKTLFVAVQKNVKVEVLDWGGTGRPIVMLAGLDLTAHLFSQFAARLTSHFHVYGITRRGFGASSVPGVPQPRFNVAAGNTYELKPLHNNPYDADRLGDDVVAVLNKLHIERPVLVGHSIAGEELTSVASRYPNRVAGLIYLDAFAEFAFSDGQRYDALFTDDHPMRVTLPPGQSPHIDVDDAVLLGMHEYRHFPNVPALAIFALPHHIEGLTGAALAAFQASEQRAVARMNRIRPLLPTVSIVDFPNADHMVWESNQADVLREMNAFIGRLPAATASAQSATQSPREISSGQQVHTRSGLVRGVVEHGLVVYRGIPFAAPPVGNLRWRAPRPAAAWTGTLDATEFKPACMQKGPTLPGMMERYSEDCLYLNIWTPAKPAGQRLAVMVYLYGGGGSSGSGSARLYWGDRLAAKGVVVVTFNYRLGAFGALAHPELTKEAGTSGNYGLLDSIAALKWVHANISAFGGDPGNVTLFGQSAGAYRESVLMVCPAARGLFRRVIASSGGEFGTEARGDADPMLAEAEQAGVAFLKRLGVSTLDEARNVPAARIVALDSAMEKDGVGALPGNIDGHLIPDSVRALYSRGEQVPVDLLVGSNADEGVNLAFAPPESAAAYRADIRAHYGGFAERFLALYPGRSDAQARQSQLRLQSDDESWRMVSWARFQSSRGIRHVYVYRFSTIPPFAPWATLHAAGHGAELPYVFGYPPIELLWKYEPADKAALHARIEDDIQSYWANFAKSGDPNGPGLPVWPAFDTKAQRILNMGDTFNAEKLPNEPALALLDAYHAS